MCCEANEIGEEQKRMEGSWLKCGVGRETYSAEEWMMEGLCAILLDDAREDGRWRWFEEEVHASAYELYETTTAEQFGDEVHICHNKYQGATLLDFDIIERFKGQLDEME